MRPLRRRATRLLLWVAAMTALVVAGAMHGGHHTYAVLNPAGEVGLKERNLMYEALGLGMIVVVPVFVMLFGFAWRYRDNAPKKAKYSPEFATHPLLETIWWGVPIAIISVLSVVTWQSSHALDPFKPLASTEKPLQIQVVALDWKWLFLYPQQHIATVNYLMMPTNTPVEFDITADAPMNSFWIPQLGGQIYAMSGMTTQLHLEADKRGTYYGSSANISGKGFADMHFNAYAMPREEFAQWAASTQTITHRLTQTGYDQLANPTTDAKLASYSDYDSGLFDGIVHKYMGHMGSKQMNMEMN